MFAHMAENWPKVHQLSETTLPNWLADMCQRQSGDAD